MTSEDLVLPPAHAQAVALGQRREGATPMELCLQRGKSPKGIGGFSSVFKYLVQEGWLTRSEDIREGYHIHFFAPNGHALVQARRRKKEEDRKQRSRAAERAFQKTVAQPIRVVKRVTREAKLLTPYQAFLTSPYWQEVRVLVLERDGHACTRCKVAESLHVHHRSYAHHGREKEYLGDLETLCEVCHKAGHGLL